MTRAGLVATAVLLLGASGTSFGGPERPRGAAASVPPAFEVLQFDGPGDVILGSTSDGVPIAVVPGPAGLTRLLLRPSGTVSHDVPAGWSVWWNSSVVGLDGSVALVSRTGAGVARMLPDGTLTQVGATTMAPWMAAMVGETVHVVTGDHRQTGPAEWESFAPDGTHLGPTPLGLHFDRAPDGETPTPNGWRAVASPWDLPRDGTGRLTVQFHHVDIGPGAGDFQTREFLRVVTQQGEVSAGLWETPVARPDLPEESDVRDFRLRAATAADGVSWSAVTAAPDRLARPTVEVTARYPVGGRASVTLPTRFRGMGYDDPFDGAPSDDGRWFGAGAFQRAHEPGGIVVPQALVWFAVDPTRSGRRRVRSRLLDRAPTAVPAIDSHAPVVAVAPDGTSLVARWGRRGWTKRPYLRMWIVAPSGRVLAHRKVVDVESWPTIRAQACGNRAFTVATMGSESGAAVLYVLRRRGGG